MKFNFLSTAAFALGMSLSGFASAEVITVSESFDITEEGQTFEFSSLISDNAVGELVFFINASGDFTGSNEILNIDDIIEINGNGVITDGKSLSVSGFSELSFSSETILDRRDVSFFAEFISFFPAEAFAGEELIFNVSTSSDVSTFFADGFAGTDADFVELGFTFDVAEVSEPTTLAIFGLGLMGLAARRFKKNA